MSEIAFWVEEAAEGGYSAQALGESLFTQAGTVEDLRQQVRGAVHYHFEPGTGRRWFVCATKNAIKFTDEQRIKCELSLTLPYFLLIDIVEAVYEKLVATGEPRRSPTP